MNPAQLAIRRRAAATERAAAEMAAEMADMPIPAPEDLMEIPQFARYCWDAPVTTVRYWLQTGQIHAYRCGRRVLIPASERNRLLKVRPGSKPR